MTNVKTEIQKMNLAQLNELSEFISDMKVMVGKTTLSVGQKVFVVQNSDSDLYAHLDFDHFNMNIVKIDGNKNCVKQW